MFCYFVMKGKMMILSEGWNLNTQNILNTQWELKQNYGHEEIGSNVSLAIQIVSYFEPVSHEKSKDSEK